MIKRLLTISAVLAVAAVTTAGEVAFAQRDVSRHHNHAVSHKTTVAQTTSSKAKSKEP